MTVLERSELEASPLADLHTIADQLGLDGFRRLRKGDLIEAILTHEGADAGEAGASEPEEPGAPEPEPGAPEPEEPGAPEPEEPGAPEPEEPRGRRGAAARRRR